MLTFFLNFASAPIADYVLSLGDVRAEFLLGNDALQIQFADSLK